MCQSCLVKRLGPFLSESKLSLNTQNFSFFFLHSFLSPKGKLEAFCDNLQHTTVPLMQPTIYIEDRDPIPEEQVKKKKKKGYFQWWASFLYPSPFQLLVQWPCLPKAGQVGSQCNFITALNEKIDVFSPWCSVRMYSPYWGEKKKKKRAPVFTCSYIYIIKNNWEKESSNTE